MNKLPRQEIYEDKKLFDKAYPDLEVELNCDSCNNALKLPRSRFRSKLKDKTTNFFCNRQCYLEYHKSKNRKEYECKYCLNKFESLLPDNANLFCSRDCYHKSNYHAEQTSGDKHWQWNGGITLEQRNSPQYAEFRMSILKRDNFTCQHCNERGGTLRAHHIKGWKFYPELRWEETNLITLCESCHRETHRVFGYNTIEDMLLQK